MSIHHAIDSDRVDLRASRYPLVELDQSALGDYLDAAAIQYCSITADDPRVCFGVLVGELGEGCVRIDRIEFARNARPTDPTANSEFVKVVAPCYGSSYLSPRRGFWCDSRDLLAIARRADAEDLEIVGSIHMHPDWHRIGPPADQGMRLSEQPTPMDQHMFLGSCWPTNMICYIEPCDVGLRAILGATGIVDPGVGALPVCGSQSMNLVRDGTVTSGSVLDLGRLSVHSPLPPTFGTGGRGEQSPVSQTSSEGQ